MPLIDAHCHLDHHFGGGWIDRPAAELLEVLDEVGVTQLVDLSGGWGLDALHRHLDHFKAVAPERFTMLGGIDWSSWPEHGEAFGERAATSLQAQLQRGASGLKVWKTLGLEAVDHRGQLVRIDDARLAPVWQVCADGRVPVVIHVGDPHDFFLPVGPTNPRSGEIAEHPEWHWHQRSPVTHEQLFDQLEALVAAWPAIRFVGPHLLDLVHAPSHLAQLLSDHPNLSVDLGARFPELAAHDPQLLAVLTDHTGQVLYGLDHPPSVAHYERTIAVTHVALHEAARHAGRLADLADLTEAVLWRNAHAIFGP